MARVACPSRHPQAAPHSCIRGPLFVVGPPTRARGTGPLWYSGYSIGRSAGGRRLILSTRARRGFDKYRCKTGTILIIRASLIKWLSFADRALVECCEFGYT